MTPATFAENYYSYARETEKKTGIPALFALAQSALETAWGKVTPGYMLFGMKAGSGKNFGGWKGEKQLVVTSEFGASANLKFPYIFPGYPKKDGDKWKYVVKDYFRAYPSALNAYLDWGGMLASSSRYSKAMQSKGDAARFAEEVASAGYSTDSSYAQKIKVIMAELAPVVQHRESISKGWKVVIVILIASGVAAVGYGVMRSVKRRELKSKTVNI